MATRIDGQAVNGKRKRLAEVIPLDTPYSVTIFPIYACNLKCNYCIHSIDKEKRPNISEEVLMDFELYKKCIDDLCEFPQKIKALHFAGLGEPLLAPKIAEMVEYAKNKNVAEVIDIVTNGLNLNEELSKALVRAGLDKLRISLQGMTAIKYKEITGIDIEFDNFIKNIEYFYNNKEKTKVYIKIMDIALDENEDLFFKTFDNKCDFIAIECLCPLIKDIDYNKKFKIDSFNKTMNNNNTMECEVCPQPFFSLQVYPDGQCIPCCTVEKPISVGNIKKESLVKIWNGKTFTSFRKSQLKKEKDKNISCKNCTQYKFAMFPEENLDIDSEKLLNFFGED